MLVWKIAWILKVRSCSWTVRMLIVSIMYYNYNSWLFILLVSIRQIIKDRKTQLRYKIYFFSSNFLSLFPSMPLPVSPTCPPAFLPPSFLAPYLALFSPPNSFIFVFFLLTLTCCFFPSHLSSLIFPSSFHWVYYFFLLTNGALEQRSHISCQVHRAVVARTELLLIQISVCDQTVNARLCYGRLSWNSIRKTTDT